MKRLLPFLKLLVLVAAIAAVCFAADALAKGGGPPGACPRDIQCPLYYDPVTCDNGVTYSNSCFAYADCATGCTEGGGGL